MIKNLGILLVIVLIIFGVWKWVESPSVSSQQQVVPVSQTSTKPVSKTINTNVVVPTTKTTPTPIVNQSPQSQPGKVFLADQNLVINASDNGADMTNIVVTKGTRVNLTINVSLSGAGHGGLDFRSSVINTGTIAPGGSIQTGFIADKSFTITPYWPATNTATPYRINITVQ